MSNVSNQNTRKSTSSGHGALGMGGQPFDDPHDMNSSGWNPGDDRSRPVDGASGGRRGDLSGGNVAGVEGDRSVSQEIETAAGKSS
jgi:hypothetical protein